MEWTECPVSNHLNDEFGDYWICDIGKVPANIYLNFTHPEGRDILLGKFSNIEDAKAHAERHYNARTGVTA